MKVKYRLTGLPSLAELITSKGVSVSLRLGDLEGLRLEVDVRDGWQLPLSHTLPGKTKAQCQSHCNIALFSVFYETAMSMSIAQKLHRRKQDLVSPTHGHGSPLPNVVLDESKSAYQHPNKKSTFLKGKDECVAFSFAQVNRDITPITSRVELIGSTKLDIILFDAFPLQNPPNTLKMLRSGLTKAVPATDLREL